MEKLTFEEFVKKCELILEKFSGNGELEYFHYEDELYEYSRRKTKPKKIEEIRLIHKYETGGVSGGSCWDSSDPQPYSIDRPDDKFEIFDYLLSELNPRIAFLDYQKLQKQIKETEITDREYYGNCTEYILLSIPLQVIYDSIKSSWEKEPS